MNFGAAKRRLIASLRSGNYQHELRAIVEGKNPLDTGEVRPEDVLGRGTGRRRQGYGRFVNHLADRR